MGWTDWAKAARSYAGWVPNVGSHLSFSLIGADSRSMVARLTRDHREADGSVGRMVCLLDKRQTDDFLWPPELMRRIVPSVVQHFAMVAMTEPVPVPTGFKEDHLSDENGFRIGKRVEIDLDEQGALVGRVHILPHYVDPGARLVQRWMIDEISALLAQPAPTTKIEQLELLANIERCVRWRSPEAVTIKFALMRTGEIRLWYAQSYADLKEAEYVLAAKQAYFFIKDMAHQHVHHDPASDQITPLVKFEMLAEKPEKADTDWRRRTLWNLAREAERQGKLCRLDKQREALGILAFADAFQKTLLPYRRDPADPAKFRPNDSVYGYDFNFIRESTKLRVDQMASQRGAVAPMLSAMVAGAIAALALVSSLVATRNGSVREMLNNEIRQGKATTTTLVTSRPLELGIHESIMAFMAAYPWAAAILTVGVLGTLYKVMLNDVLASNWKPWQRLRGLSISFVIALGSRSRVAAHNTLNIFYLVLMGVEVALIYVVVGWLLALAP